MYPSSTSALSVKYPNGEVTIHYYPLQDRTGHYVHSELQSRIYTAQPKSPFVVLA